VILIVMLVGVPAERSISSVLGPAPQRRVAVERLISIGDLAGSTGVLVGLIFVRAGYPKADRSPPSHRRGRPLRGRRDSPSRTPTS